jgi:Biopolymer transport protein ExbD/TolR
MKHRRLRKTAAHLEITAFINLIVVLVPFLLSVAVFTRLAVIDLSLPAQTSGPEQLKENNLQLEVVIRPDALEVGDRIGGLIQRIPDTATGHDVKTLGALVQVMDAVRAGHTVQGAKVVTAELFPNISIGDAPIVKPNATR